MTQVSQKGTVSIKVPLVGLSEPLFAAMFTVKHIAKMSVSRLMGQRDYHRKMNDTKLQGDDDALERALSLAEAALNECDRAGFIYAAIDISSAIDKLKALKMSERSS